MPLHRCPICNRKFERSDSPAPPFCSTRCREIDLGRWLGEGYAVPSIGRDESPTDEPDELPEN